MLARARALRPETQPGLLEGANAGLFLARDSQWGRVWPSVSCVARARRPGIGTRSFLSRCQTVVTFVPVLGEAR